MTLSGGHTLARGYLFVSVTNDVQHCIYSSTAAPCLRSGACAYLSCMFPGLAIPVTGLIASLPSKTTLTKTKPQKHRSASNRSAMLMPS